MDKIKILLDLFTDKKSAELVNYYFEGEKIDKDKFYGLSMFIISWARERIEKSNLNEGDYTQKTLGEFLSSKDPIIKRNAISILKKLQNIA